MLGCSYALLAGSVSKVEYLVVDELQSFPGIIETVEMTRWSSLRVGRWLQDDTGVIIEVSKELDLDE